MLGLNVALGCVFFWSLFGMHELGHVAAMRKCGVKEWRLEIGRGRVVLDVHRVRVGIVPTSWTVKSPLVRSHRKIFCVAMAGPVTTLAIGGLALLIVRLLGLKARAWLPASALAIGFFDLLPLRIIGKGGGKPTDGRQVLEIMLKHLPGVRGRIVAVLWTMMAIAGMWLAAKLDVVGL